MATTARHDFTAFNLSSTARYGQLIEKSASHTFMLKRLKVSPNISASTYGKVAVKIWQSTGSPEEAESNLTNWMILDTLHGVVELQFDALKATQGYGLMVQARLMSGAGSYTFDFDFDDTV